MKKVNIFKLIVIIVVSLTLTSQNFIKAEKNIDLFEEIIRGTNSSVVEYGTTISFKTNESDEEECMSLLKKLEFYDPNNVKTLRNNNTYCIDFIKDNYKGYIEKLAYDGYNVITINVVMVNSKNQLKQLKTKIKNAIKGRTLNNNFFDYLKLKTKNEDLMAVNNKIKDILKEGEAINIESVDISNGYSTTAYTGKYKAIKSSGKLIDFNYGVCRYTSGNYIIIGTPQIIVSY